MICLANAVHCVFLVIVVCYFFLLLTIQLNATLRNNFLCVVCATFLRFYYVFYGGLVFHIGHIRWCTFLVTWRSVVCNFFLLLFCSQEWFLRRIETTCSRLSYDICSRITLVSLLSLIQLPLSIQFDLNEQETYTHTHPYTNVRFIRTQTLSNDQTKINRVCSIVRSVGKPSCRWSRIPIQFHFIIRCMNIVFDSLCHSIRRVCYYSVSFIFSGDTIFNLYIIIFFCSIVCSFQVNRAHF